MKTLYVLSCLAALGAVSATPARAQFDPVHNHLACYKISVREKPVVKTVLLSNQFGRQRVVKLTPQLLCVPTQKTCCQPGATAAACQPIPCPPDPTPVQPAPVDHFECYKLATKECADTDPGCANTGKFPKNISVNLTDQFGAALASVTTPQLLCAPVLKEVVSPTTTTTTTTSSTTTTTVVSGCQLDSTVSPPMCGGFCPSPTICLSTSATSCDCVQPPQECQGPVATACGGLLCPSPVQVCQFDAAAQQCQCSTPIPCNQSAPPACGGTCPAGTTCQISTAGQVCSCG
jgi:hypothetical protein